MTLGIDVKAHIRELFAAEWKKEYGSNKDLYNKTPDVLKIKGDISELLEMIRKKKKVYYSWKEKVLYIAAKKVISKQYQCIRRHTKFMVSGWNV